MLATGGLSYPKTGSDGDGYRIAEHVGHTINKCSPVLVALRCEESWITEVEGLSLRNVRLDCARGKKTIYSEQGEMLFTKDGISGPIALSLSSYLAGESFDGLETWIDLKPALDEVMQNGYGVVTPTLDDMKLEDPEIVKQGSKYGIKLKASAPSLHIMRVDINTEVSPIVGTEQQSEDLVKYLLSKFENNPQGIWDTEMFGKSLHQLVGEGLSNKLYAMPKDAQGKMRKTLGRIVNEGKGGVICILL